MLAESFLLWVLKSAGGARVLRLRVCLDQCGMRSNQVLSEGSPVLNGLLPSNSRVSVPSLGSRQFAANSVLERVTGILKKELLPHTAVAHCREVRRHVGNSST